MVQWGKGWFMSLLLLFQFETSLEASPCSINEFAVVRNISELGQDSYGVKGLSHITVAGAILHGLKEVEIWLNTYAPGARTPIHRHDCEEAFVVLKGSGTLFLANSDPQNQLFPKQYSISANTTFHIPPHHVHQVWNTNEDEDLQVLVIISRPPMKPYVYEDWSMPHTAATLLFPLPWDQQCLPLPSPQQQKEEL